MVLAVDLSTRNIGIIIADGKVVYQRHTLELAPFDKDLKNNVEEIKRVFKKIAWYFVLDQVVIELANFRSAALTQKFAFYAGVIYSIFSKYQHTEIKYFNANQWQFKIGCLAQDNRDTRKQKAADFAKKYINITGWTQDEIDAYCMALVAKELQSTFEQHQAIQKAKRRKYDQKRRKQAKATNSKRKSNVSGNDTKTPRNNSK